MLTKEEALLAAEAADKYPEGYGNSWLAIDDETLKELVDEDQYAQFRDCEGRAFTAPEDVYTLMGAQGRVIGEEYG